MKKKIKGAVTISILLFLMLFGLQSSVYGAEREGDTQKSGSIQDIEEEIGQYDFTQIEDALKEKELDFGPLVRRLATGQSEGVFSELFSMVMDRLFGDVAYNRETVVKIMMIAIISSLFTNMSAVLKKSEMSETGFYVTYMLLITILMSGFLVISDMVSDVLTDLITFMNALVPAFFLSVGVSGGTLSATGFSQIVLIAIAIIDKLILRFIVPMVNIYVIILLVNNVVGEDYFSRFADVIKTFASWALKGFVTVLMGANIIQGIILPSVDGAKVGIVNKLINILPGGTAITGVEGILMTTGNVIKNAIGGAGLVALCVICLLPLAKMLIYTAMYKLTGAVVQPVSDKRLGAGMDAVTEGIGLLYKIILTTAFLFFITIAIVCITTGRI